MTTPQPGPGVMPGEVSQLNFRLASATEDGTGARAAVAGDLQ